MEKRIFTLTEEEKKFKHCFLYQDQKILDKALTYYDYENLDDALKLYDTSIAKYHKKVSAGSPGNTIIDVSEGENYVELVRHARYSFPLLHNHSYIEMIYVYSGTCTHFVEDQAVEMKEGDLCILAPNAMHAVAAKADDSIILNVLMSEAIFDSGFLHMLTSDFLLTDFLKNVLYNRRVSPYILFPTGSDAWMQEVFLQMYDEKEKRMKLHKENLLLLIKQVFIHLIRHYQMYGIVANPIDNNPDNNIVAVMGYISVNYNHITLKELAQFFGYNETYLGLVIQKYTGQNFTALLNEIQMKNASRLLIESNLSVTEIGCEVGCYDASHFTRKFKKQYGMTPNQYRNQNR